MIQKVIHYCWFGNEKKDKVIQECIESWHSVLPEYAITEWNENNYASDSFFFNYCLNQKLYAFASDYARLDILKKYGGVYLDTDMMLIKSIDELLQNELFFGLESTEHVSCGIIAAKANNKVIKELIEELEKVDNPGFFLDYTIVKFVTAYFLKSGFIIMPELQKSVQFYPVDYFYAFPYGVKSSPFSFLTENSFAVHLWNASWIDPITKAFVAIKNKKFCKGWQIFIIATFRKPKNVKSLFSIIRLSLLNFFKN